LFFIGILAGIIIGVVLSLLLLIASASQSPVRRMVLDKENNVFVDADKHPDAETIPGIVVAEIHGPLFFADASNFRASVMEMVQEYEPHSVVIDLDAATTMDMDGVEILTKISGELGRQDIKVLLARVDSEHIELFKRIDAMDEIGSQNIYETVRTAVDAAQQTDMVSGEETAQSPGSPDSQENSE